ncbi:hypothetical protein [Sorangium sp. So ce233]|uniref:hypothetical protein n=1 Tax=Sorangium sp. So ce233 TaxID=3133290 RepID=UPI003F638C9B
MGIANSGTTYVEYRVTVQRASASEQVLLSLDLNTKDRYGNFRYLGAPGSTLEISTEDFGTDSLETRLSFTEEVTRGDVFDGIGTVPILLRIMNYYASTDTHHIAGYTTELVNPAPLAPNTITNGPGGWLLGSSVGSNETAFVYSWQKKLLIWVPVILNSTEGKDLRPVGENRSYRRRVTSRYSIIPSTVSNVLKPN